MTLYNRYELSLIVGSKYADTLINKAARMRVYKEYRNFTAIYSYGKRISTMAHYDIDDLELKILTRDCKKRNAIDSDTKMLKVIKRLRELKNESR